MCCRFLPPLAVHAISGAVAETCERVSTDALRPSMNTACDLAGPNGYEEKCLKIAWTQSMAWAPYLKEGCLLGRSAAGGWLPLLHGAGQVSGAQPVHADGAQGSAWTG